MMRKLYPLLLSSLFVATTALADGFTLSSPEFKNGETVSNRQVFNGFGCEGGNVSPALSWQGAPAGTRSFAVTMYDPDAPTGSGWWHWVVFNIPADAKGLPVGAGNLEANRLPAGAVQSRTDFGSAGYGGPCPPQGDQPHRYQLTVHALNVESISLDKDVPAAMVGYFLNQHRIASARLTSQYSR